MDTQATLNDDIEFEDLNKLGVKLTTDQYDRSQNRTYVRMEHPEANRTMHRTAWRGCLSQTAEIPYHCPSGWCRYASKVRMTANFWASSSNMYHGTDPRYIQPIIEKGFRPTKCQHARPAVYLTPSIRYAAHPRYARILQIGRLYYQVVLQVRVLNHVVKSWKEAAVAGASQNLVWTSLDPIQGSTSIGSGSETMSVGESEKIDDNFPDNQNMEFLYETDEPYVTPKLGLVVTGVLIRCLAQDPIGMPENSWWLYWARDPDVNDSDSSPEDWLRSNFLKRLAF